MLLAEAEQYAHATSEGGRSTPMRRTVPQATLRNSLWLSPRNRALPAWKLDVPVFPQARARARGAYVVSN